MKTCISLILYLVLTLASLAETSELPVVSLEFSSTVSAGTTYYVSTAGNDSSDGLSEATAWLTLANANATLQPEDELIVEDYTIALVGADTGITTLRLVISSLILVASDSDEPVWSTTVGVAAVTVDGTGGNVSVNFGDATDSDDGTNIIYSIYYAPSSSWNEDWSLNNVIAASSSPFTIPDLSNDVEFTFGVRVSDQSGNEDSNTVTLTATPIWDTPPVIIESQISIAYKDRTSEGEIEQSEENGDDDNLVSMTISLSCNTVEYNNALTRPIATIPMQGRFYVIIGALRADWLPPDPGAAGKSTIAGIDSDGDCVRDDIERYIAQQLPGSGQKNARKYLFEYAKWRGQFLVNGLGEDDSRDITRNLYRSAECVRRILGNDMQSRALLNHVFAKFHNTFPRTDRYIDNNGVLGGWSTREEITVSCP